jgi:hypothetical protein
MTTDRWTCPRCGQIYRIDEPSCPVCAITRENRDVVGKITTVRPAPKPAPPPEPVEVVLPFAVREARFNLPVSTGGTVWTSGLVLATEHGLFLLTEKDAADADDFARKSTRSLMPVGETSMFYPSTAIKRVVHERLAGYFIELHEGKVPLRLSVEGWKELDVVLDRLRIAHT